MPTPEKMIDLNELNSGLPAISPAFGSCLAEAGGVCLAAQGHQFDKEMLVQGTHQKSFRLRWPQITQQVLNCWNDLESATEHGAMGVAILLIRKLAGYSVVQRSRKGTGFDYWLGHDDGIPFQNMARLEVSGIRKGDERTIKTRVRQKLKQVAKSDGSLPAYIVVVEFGTPISEVAEK